MNIKASWNWLLVVLLVLDLSFIVLHVSTGWSIINLDEECNLTAWYSSMKLMGLCVLCLMIYRGERSTPRAEERRYRLTWLWLLVAAVFLFLSADETASMHERLARFIMQESAVGLDIRETVLDGDAMKDSFAWVLLLSPFILGVTCFFAFFFYQRLKPYPDSFIPALAALGLFLMAIGLEGTIYLLPPFDEWSSRELFLYRLSIGFEEAGEMIGSTLFLLAFNNYRRHL